MAVNITQADTNSMVTIDTHVNAQEMKNLEIGRIPLSWIRRHTFSCKGPTSTPVDEEFNRFAQTRGVVIVATKKVFRSNCDRSWHWWIFVTYYMTSGIGKEVFVEKGAVAEDSSMEPDGMEPVD